MKVVSLGQFGPAPDRDTFAADLALHFAEEVARWRTFGLDTGRSRAGARRPSAKVRGSTSSGGGTERVEG